MNKSGLRALVLTLGFLFGALVLGCGESFRIAVLVPSPPTMSPSVKVSTPTDPTFSGFSGGGKRNVFVSGDNVYVVWIDNRNGDFDVWFSRSSDGGQTFSAEIMLNQDNAAAHQDKPVVAADTAGNVYVVWEDGRNGDLDIFMAVSHDGGATFPVERKVDAGTGSVQTEPSVMAAGGGKLYFSWIDNRNGESELFLAKSLDEGATLSYEKPVFPGTPNKTYSGSTVRLDPQGRIYLSWYQQVTDFDIYFSRSDDDGTTFNPPLKVNDDTGDAHQKDPSMGIDNNGNVFIAWYDFRSGKEEVYFSKSTDRGASFSGNIRLSDPYAGAKQMEPSLSVNDAGVVFVCWKDNRNGDYDIYGVRSSDQGVTFTPNFRVDDDATGADQIDTSAFVRDDGTLYSVWLDRRTAAGIYFRKGK